MLNRGIAMEQWCESTGKRVFRMAGPRFAALATWPAQWSNQSNPTDEGRTMRNSLILLLTILGLARTHAQPINIVVPGTSDPWLAGMPDGTMASGSDVAPAQSPILVTGLSLMPGKAAFFPGYRRSSQRQRNRNSLPAGRRAHSKPRHWS
jgi:hypothetical protein